MSAVSGQYSPSSLLGGSEGSLRDGRASWTLGQESGLVVNISGR